MVGAFVEMTSAILYDDPTMESKRETLEQQLGSIEASVAKMHTILSSLRDHQVNGVLPGTVDTTSPTPTACFAS
jgi:uncharacterized membrane protein